MNSIKLGLTAQTPSRFGMPISGRAFGVFGAGTPASVVRIAAPAMVRERAVVAATDGAAKGHVRLGQSCFPGTSAWSPPIC